VQTRYEPTTINDLQKCLDGCSDKMRVEVKDGISLDVKTVADLRFLLVWPSGLAVVVPDERDRRESVVVVERRNAPPLSAAVDDQWVQRRILHRAITTVKRSATSDEAGSSRWRPIGSWTSGQKLTRDCRAACCENRTLKDEGKTSIRSIFSTAKNKNAPVEIAKK
jgi:hypothetical protein